jgi:hypothetical protein
MWTMNLECRVELGTEQLSGGETRAGARRGGYTVKGTMLWEGNSVTWMNLAGSMTFLGANVAYIYMSSSS